MTNYRVLIDGEHPASIEQQAAEEARASPDYHATSQSPLTPGTAAPKHESETQEPLGQKKSSLEPGHTIDSVKRSGIDSKIMGAMRVIQDVNENELELVDQHDS